MQPVPRGPPGQAGRKRRRAALEVRPRAAHRVAVDHDPRVTVGDVVSRHRWHDGLVVDAGVGHQDAHPGAGGDDAALEPGHLLALSERPVAVEIDAARVRDRGNRHPCILPDQLFHEVRAGLADRFRVGHHVRLADGHQIARVEHPRDLELVVDRPGQRPAHLPGLHGTLFSGQDDLRHVPSRGTGARRHDSAARRRQATCPPRDWKLTGARDSLLRQGGCNSTVECQLPKLDIGVRFPSPAPRPPLHRRQPGPDARPGRVSW